MAPFAAYETAYCEVMEAMAKKIGELNREIADLKARRRAICRNLARGRLRRGLDGDAPGWLMVRAPTNDGIGTHWPLRRVAHMIQTGVLVLSPRYHRELLEHVYNVYEDAGGVEMNYEMRPLSFEIQQNGLQHWIDNRFNALVGPLTLHSQLILKRLLLSDWEIAAFLKAEYARNYFLHFAGAHHLMKLLIGNGQDPSASKSLNRNASCPCGSGKRYKHCHGRYA